MGDAAAKHRPSRGESSVSLHVLLGTNHSPEALGVVQAFGGEERLQLDEDRMDRHGRRPARDCECGFGGSSISRQRV